MDYYSSYEAVSASPYEVVGSTPQFWAFLGLMLIPVIIGGLVVYVYCAIALMTIAKKTNTPNAWLAWIPFANFYLMTQIAQVPWWTFLFTFLFIIPGINIFAGIVVLGLSIWWWMKIAQRRGRPDWWGVLIAIIPIVNLVLMGMLAWGEAEGHSAKPKAS